MDLVRLGSRCGRLPWALPAMLVLVVAVEAFVSRHPLIALDQDDWQYHLARRDSARHARGQDVLFLGDSLIKNGVLPRVVGSRCGLEVYNLAISGVQAPGIFHVLRSVLRSGSRPSAVVVNFSPHLLALPPQVNWGRWPHLMGCRELVEMGLQSRDASFVASLLIRRCIPSFRGRHALRAAVLAAVAARHDDGEKMAGALRHWGRHAGAHVLPSSPGEPWNLDGYQKLVYPLGWKPNRVNAEYVLRFLTLAEEHGLTVYWLITPVHPALQLAKEHAGVEAKLLALVQSYRARFPNLVVIDGSQAQYDPSVFHDPIHLGREGAFALSEDLGDLLCHLRQIPPEERWATLPRYRARVVDPDIETAVAAMNGIRATLR